MTTYRLSATVGVSAYTVVEAETPEEAISIGAKRDVQFGGLMSGASEDESWLIDEADGLPDNIVIDQE